MLRTLFCVKYVLVFNIISHVHSFPNDLDRRRSSVWGSIFTLRGGFDDHVQNSETDTFSCETSTASLQNPQALVTPKRALVLMDVFSEYHGMFLAHQAHEAYGVATIRVLSNYMRGFFETEGREELEQWQHEFMPQGDEALEKWKESVRDYELVGIYCESDSGLADMERFGNQLNLTHHCGFNDARRNKYEMIETMRKAGIASVKQQLCETEEEAIHFAEQLGIQDSEENTGCIVVKPIRGVASDDVHLCKDLSSVRNAFRKIQGSSVFGSPTSKHDTVLVQEFAKGQEFAVDIVCKNGTKKVAAIWMYDKRSRNGAPFVYHATTLYDGEYSQEIFQFLSEALDALEIRWGLSHSEVIMTENGLRLIEVNCRQHNMDFIPLAMMCYGYNAFDMLLAAYLGDKPKNTYPSSGAGRRLDWDSLPVLPQRSMEGQMVHLSCCVEGELISINEAALMEIQQMESVVDLEIYGYFLLPGNRLKKTIDIRTDCGWVQMVNSDKSMFKRDYDRILELMPTFFNVRE